MSSLTTLRTGNLVPIMIWRTDPEGSHDYYNDRWQALDPGPDSAKHLLTLIHSIGIATRDYQWRRVLERAG